jgi:hypothetical protein
MSSYPGNTKTLSQPEIAAIQDTVVVSLDTIDPADIIQDTAMSSSNTITEINGDGQPAQVTDIVAVIIPVVAPVIPAQNSPSVPSITFDSSRYQYDAKDLSDDNHLNFLKKSNDQFFYVEDPSRLVYSNDPHQSYSTETQINQESLSAMKTEQLIKPDWLIGIIIGCLIIFAWLKLFYNKFIDQTFISLWNFQLSENFLRDQSIFSRRVSMLLNLNFIITAGLFFYLVAVFFDMNPWILSPFNIFLASTGIVTFLLSARYIVSHLSGAVFSYHKLFKDYLSQILIIYKIAGIVLIPIIMAIAYLPDNFRIYLIITGLVLLAASVLFRFVKGIQLIFNKDVSRVYLILYLCTLEFLPALVIYKFFSSLVYFGQ